MKCLIVASAIFALSSALGIPKENSLLPRASCEHTATSRSCWGDFDIDTDYSTVIPDTGVTREYWLAVQSVTLAPDGYSREVLVFNGSYPGPTITADWGDNLIIHVTNELLYNGTAIHWHGIRQLNSNQYDGVPGVTQCPIAPGKSMTYKFRAEQYGTTWYHSHFSLQAAEGLTGGIIINGPSTANYDEDLGTMLLTDWSHTSAFDAWKSSGIYGLEIPTQNGLINGTNTFDCSSTDAACIGGGKRYETRFVKGKKYRFRLVGSQADGYIKFTIDNHVLTVIANDLVPIVPYNTTNVILASGQRYDIIVTANREAGNFWLRSLLQTSCNLISNDKADDVLGIIRYEGADTTVEPTSTSYEISDSCGDEPKESLVPWLKNTVGAAYSQKELALGFTYEVLNGFKFHWTVNTKYLEIDWAEPTLQIINDGGSAFPTDSNIVDVAVTNQWVYFVIQDLVNGGAYHPIHLHGHDFYVLAQGYGVFVPALAALNLENPPRRDTATLNGYGYLVVAFYTDNPGTWLMHCHIAWHASQGFALQFVEREGDIAATVGEPALLNDTCTAWDEYVPMQMFEQDDSGI